MTTAPENISDVDKAAFANRKWDAAMLRFLRLQRRKGKPIRWIAEKLGVTLVRAVAHALNEGLVQHTAYRGRRCLTPPEPELEPTGTVREIPEDNQCRWINTDPTEPWTMCARPTTNTSAWCPHHHARVYVRRPSQTSFVIAGQAPQKLSVMAGLDPATQGHGHKRRGPHTKADLNLLGGRVALRLPGHDELVCEGDVGKGQGTP